MAGPLPNESSPSTYNGVAVTHDNIRIGTSG